MKGPEGRAELQALLPVITSDFEGSVVFDDFHGRHQSVPRGGRQTDLWVGLGMRQSHCRSRVLISRPATRPLECHPARGAEADGKIGPRKLDSFDSWDKVAIIVQKN